MKAAIELSIAYFWRCPVCGAENFTKQAVRHLEECQCCWTGYEVEFTADTEGDE